MNVNRFDLKEMKFRHYKMFRFTVILYSYIKANESAEGAKSQSFRQTESQAQHRREVGLSGTKIVRLELLSPT